ncbi:MAG: hypothetical protein JWQ49_4071 [Edaphobacter sp.]|nr:hypothetical protein [Edaphobacter sp.]
MKKDVGSETWQAQKSILLKHLKHGDLDDFVQVVCSFIKQDFDATLSLLSTQRLLTASRDVETTAYLCRNLFDRIDLLSLSGKQKSKLKTHLKISTEFQTIMSILAKRSSQLKIWNHSFTTLVVHVATNIDFVALRVHHDDALTMAEIAPFDGKEVSESFRNGYVRDISDDANVIINEARRLFRKGQLGSDDSPVDVDDLVEAFGVANDTLKASQFWDFYSYKNAHASVTDESITIRVQQTNQQRAWDWSKTRHSSADSVDKILFGKVYLPAQQKHLKALSGLQPQQLEVFLESPAGEELRKDLHSVKAIISSNILKHVGRDLDLDAKFTLEAGIFSARELAKVWGILMFYMACGRIWQRAIYDATNSVIVATLKRGTLVLAIQESLEVDETKARSLIDQFELVISQSNRWDLFYRPLIHFNDSEVMLALTVIETSRFYRNLLTIIVTEGGGDLSMKGKKHLDLLEKDFMRAGFRILRDKKIFDPGGKPLTDVDLAVSKDGEVILFQSKILIQSDTSYDEWKINNILKNAAEQMNSSIPELQRFLARHAKGLAIDPKKCNVTLALVTNVWNYTGAEVGKYLVVDTSYLSMILNGATVSTIRSDTNERFARRKFIADDFPTGQEFVFLMKNPIHQEVFEIEEPAWAEITICDRKFRFHALESTK